LCNHKQINQQETKEGVASSQISPSTFHPHSLMTEKQNGMDIVAVMTGYFSFVQEMYMYKACTTQEKVDEKC
jgi:hypothetical protein